MKKNNNMVDVSKISFGCELEWSDIDRTVDIPMSLGEWEGPKIAGYHMGSEIDIVNTKGRWRGHGTDPLCLTCPVGGEIHVQPSYTIESQLLRVMRIMELFPTVCVACPNHGHIHVGLPGIKNDLKTLKNIFAYTQDNEADLMRLCCGYDEWEYQEVLDSNLEDWVKSYLLIGDGKQISPTIYKQVEEAESVEQVLELLRNTPAIDYDWVKKEGEVQVNSRRTCVNLYNLIKGETVEFRIFRASTNPVEIYSSLMFCKRYIEEAVKGVSGKSVQSILEEGDFKFAKLNFDEELAKGWQETRSTKGRCGCFKHYMGTTIPSEDPVYRECIDEESKELSAFDQGLLDILKLCELDFNRKQITH